MRDDIELRDAQFEQWNAEYIKAHGTLAGWKTLWDAGWAAGQAAERERCVRIAEQWSDGAPGGCDGVHLAALIREQA